MRVLLIIAAVVLLLALVGWIKFGDSPERSTITIEKEAIRQDTESMTEKGNEFLDNARDAVAPDRPNANAEPVPADPNSPQVAEPAEPPDQAPGTL